MSDKFAQTYTRYLAAWSNISDPERTKMVGETVTDDVVFNNPTQTRRGRADLVAHLEGFQQRTPNGSFRLNTMVVDQDYRAA